MRIAALSDFHLGAKERSPREKDTIIQAREALERAIELDSDIILISGDIFDQRTPSQELWAEAMRILRLPKSSIETQVELSDIIGRDKEEISPLALRGIPIIAIHGNHERRGTGLVDPIEALEAAGLVIKLNHNAIVFENSSEKVAIHGMGFVPEEDTMNVIDIWRPKPIENAYNILMIHQSLGHFTYSEDEDSVLVPGALPEGFDLYISGHVHYQSDTEIHDSPLIFPGSTFRTQLSRIEAEVSKGFFMIDTDEKPVFNPIKLNSVRDFFYEEKEFHNSDINQIEDWVVNKMNEILKTPVNNKNKKILVRFRLKGKLNKGNSIDEFITSDILDKFSDEAIVFISKRELTSPDLEEQTQFLRDIRERRVPLDEMTMKILKSKLDDMKYDNLFDVDSLYWILSEGIGDKAFKIISKEIDRLTEDKLEDKK